MGSLYAEAQRQGQAVVRRTLLDAASRILVEEGPRALTMRRVAAAVGCSTTVLYTQFDGKDGLVDALYREGFERFRRRLEAAASAPEVAADPIARQVALARAYRASALEEPDYYRVMFMGAMPGYTPSPESLAVANASIGALADAVRESMAAGILLPGDAEAVAEVLWAAAHGVVSLELAGHFPDPEVAVDRYRTLAWAALTPFLADPAAARRLMAAAPAAPRGGAPRRLP